MSLAACLSAWKPESPLWGYKYRGAKQRNSTPAAETQVSRQQGGQGWAGLLGWAGSRGREVLHSLGSGGRAGGRGGDPFSSALCEIMQGRDSVATYPLGTRTVPSRSQHHPPSHPPAGDGRSLCQSEDLRPDPVERRQLLVSSVGGGWPLQGGLEQGYPHPWISMGILLLSYRTFLNNPQSTEWG